MNDDVFNMQLRKFLKKVGITSQRDIEHAVREAINAGKLKGNETLKARMTLVIADIGLNVDIEDEIALE